MMSHSFLFMLQLYASCPDYIYELFIFHFQLQIHRAHALLFLGLAFHRFIVFSYRFSYQDDLINQLTIHYKVQGNLF